MNVRYKFLEPAYWSVAGNDVTRLALFAESTPVYVIDPVLINGAGSGPTGTVTPTFLNSQIQTFSGNCTLTSNGMGYNNWNGFSWLTDVDGADGLQTRETFLATLSHFLIKNFSNPTLNPENWDLNLIFTQIPNVLAGPGQYFMPVFCFFGNRGTHADLHLNEGGFTDLFTGIAIDEGNFTDAFNGTAVDEGTF